MTNPKIGFIGLGKLGLECAEVFAQHYTTYGYDLQPRDSETVKIVKRPNSKLVCLLVHPLGL